MTFGEKIDISTFKERHDVATFEVVRNPKTDKLFVASNGKTLAAEAAKWDESSDVHAFVELITDDGSMWCLYNPSSANVVKTF